MMRLNVTLGRLGTTILAVCLALGVLAAIPKGSTGISFTVAMVIQPESYTLAGYPLSPISLNPQTVLKLDFNSNATITLYMIGVPPQNITEKSNDVDQFKRFIEENADKVLLNRAISGKTIIEYAPEGIVTATLILLNEGAQAAQVICRTEILAAIAPTARLETALIYLTPAGAVLTGQWILLKMRKKET
ncbi:MAG: hypothetical protein QXQ41_01760 [Candidatus Bathyarchaeia archaeon]